MVKTYRKIIPMVIGLILLSGVSVFAQEGYPNKPIQMIIPYSAGGSLDIIGRMVADKVREDLGQPVLIVNKPGATGAIASSFVATSRPDGYTLYGAAGASFGFLHIMNPTFSYGLNDFSPIATFAKFPHVLIVNKDLPVKTLAEFVTYAKKNADTLSYGSSGYAGTDHLAFELLKLAVDMPSEIKHIPYAGSAPAITAIAGNQVQAGILPFSALIGKQIESGMIRALAVLSPERSPFRPDIPTIVEGGVPSLAASTYLSCWAPVKTPASIIKKLEDTVRRATEDKTLRERIEKMYHEVEFLNPQVLRKYADSEVSKWGGIIKKLNITVK